MTLSENVNIVIRDRPVIGQGLPAYTIAEIGTNHNRDIKIARTLVRQIAASGGRCAKFQIYEPDEIVSAKISARDYGLESLYGELSAQDVFARHLMTPKEWFPELLNLCHDVNLDCAATIHGQNGLEWAQSQELDFIKIASMDHTNLPFLRSLVNNVSTPILISFGMAELADIDAAVDILSAHRPGLAIFHCVAIYPPNSDELRLSNIDYLCRRYDVPVGFSDHTDDISSVVEARKLGALFFEKHVTLDRKQPGPDHPFALEMDDFGRYIDLLDQVPVGDTSGVANFSQQTEFLPLSQRELQNRGAYLKSLIIRRDLERGHKLEVSDIYLARPGGGLPPNMLDQIVGCRLSRSVLADDPLCLEDIELEK